MVLYHQSWTTPTANSHNKAAWLSINNPELVGVSKDRFIEKFHNCLRHDYSGRRGDTILLRRGKCHIPPKCWYIQCVVFTQGVKATASGNVEGVSLNLQQYVKTQNYREEIICSSRSQKTSFTCTHMFWWVVRLH